MPDTQRETTGPDLLDADGSASMGTMVMMSHHAFRRDLAHFEAALKQVAGGDVSRVAALRDEWKEYRNALHGHHDSEDTRIFPDLRRQHGDLVHVIDGLTADHHRIDPLLERGDRAFAALPDTTDAGAVIRELATLLGPHLATEEERVVPFLRDFKEFPTPADDAEAALYAQGFAWASHGIAPDILDKVYAMLPRVLASKIPAARAAFEERCRRAWGSARAGASRTPIPDWLD